MIHTHLLEDLHQDEVELVDECGLAAIQLLIGAVLDDQVGDVVLDPLTLLCWQCCPSELDDTLQNLRAGSRVGPACGDVADRECTIKTVYRSCSTYATSTHAETGGYALTSNASYTTSYEMLSNTSASIYVMALASNELPAVGQ